MLKHRLRRQLPVTVGVCVTAPRSGRGGMHAQTSRVSEFAGRPPGGPQPVGAGRLLAGTGSPLTQVRVSCP